MFDKFKDLFRHEDLLDDAFQVTMKMLEFDMKMYDASRTTLRDTNTSDLPFDIKKTDRKINKYELHLYLTCHLISTRILLTDVPPSFLL